MMMTMKKKKEEEGEDDDDGGGGDVFFGTHSRVLVAGRAMSRRKSPALNNPIFQLSFNCDYSL